MKRLAILFVLAAVVWGTYSLLPEPQAEPDGTAASSGKAAANWPRLAPELLQRVESSAGNSTFALQKDGGEWHVQAGSAPALRAERAKVEALANFFNANPPRRSLDGVNLAAPEQAKAYGLDAPVKRLTLADKATAYTLTFGAKNPAGDAVYATLAGGNATGQLLLLGVNWLEQAASATAYQDLRITDLMAQNITRIRVDNQDNPVELERSGPAQYRFLQPEGYGNYTVSSLDAERLLYDVTAIKGQLAPAGAHLGNATPTLTVSLWPTGSETPQTTRFYAIPGNRTQYLAQSDWQPALLAVDRVDVLKAAPDPFLLRDRRVLSFEPSDVQTQRLTFFAAEDLTPQEVVLIRGNGTRPAEELPSRDWTRQDSNATVPGLDMQLWQLSEVAFEGDAVTTRPAEARDALRWTLLDARGNVLATATFARDKTLLDGQCWLIVQDTESQGSGEERFFPVADDVLRQTESLVLQGKAADSF